MADGIFNPFGEPKKPKKDFLASTAETPLDTEFQAPPIGDVRLDGEAFVVVLKNTVLADMHKRVGLLMRDVQTKHPDVLSKYGIHIVDLDATYQTEDDETVMETPSGFLIVWIGAVPPDQAQDEAFKRLGHALNQINDVPLLEEHAIQIIERG